jgi:hypothetical protein
MSLYLLFLSEGSSLAMYECLKPGSFLLLNGNHALEIFQPAA